MRETRIEGRVSACNPLVTLEIERRVGGRKSGAAKRNEIAMPIVYPTFSTINPIPNTGFNIVSMSALIHRAWRSKIRGRLFNTCVTLFSALFFSRRCKDWITKFVLSIDGETEGEVNLVNFVLEIDI